MTRKIRRPIAAMIRRLGWYRRPPRISDDVRKEIRRRYFKREATQKQLAFDFGVSQSTISRVISE